MTDTATPDDAPDRPTTTREKIRAEDETRKHGVEATNPGHPHTLITAADVLAERKASEADGTEPDITPDNLGNPTAPDENRPGFE